MADKSTRIRGMIGLRTKDKEEQGLQYIRRRRDQVRGNQSDNAYR